MDKDKLMSSLKQYMHEKGLDQEINTLDSETKLQKYGLPAMAATKAILEDIHVYRPPTGSGFKRKLKNKIINTIKNVTISTMELAMIKQNKFNELTYQFIEYLLKENAELKERVKELEKGNE